MTWQLLTFPNAIGLRRAFLVVLLVLVLQTAFLPAATAHANTPAATVMVSSAPAPVFVAGTGLGRVLSYLEAMLMDRRRFVQLAALGMCIGLYILMRR